MTPTKKSPHIIALLAELRNYKASEEMVQLLIDHDLIEEEGVARAVNDGKQLWQSVLEVVNDAATDDTFDPRSTIFKLWLEITLKLLQCGVPKNDLLNNVNACAVLIIDDDWGTVT